MNYSERNVLCAFSIYTQLARDGWADVEAVKQYTGEADIQSLLEKFAREVDAVIIRTTDHLYMIPETRYSEFHVSNDWIKRTHLGTSALNADIYLLYFATIVLLGAFFDRYNTEEPTLQFLRLTDWVTKMNERIRYLQTYNEEQLSDLESEFNYNWRAIIDKWEDMDDIKESAKRQRGRTISRLSFIHKAKDFLIAEGIIKDIGNQEVTITEKTQIIIQRYFMDVAYNKNIFEFIYGDEVALNNGDD